MKLFEKQIKELHGSDRRYCEAVGQDWTNFPKKKKTALNKLNWLNDFLKPLKLRVVIERCS